MENEKLFQQLIFSAILNPNGFVQALLNEIYCFNENPIRKQIHKTYSFTQMSSLEMGCKIPVYHVIERKGKKQEEQSCIEPLTRSGTSQ